MNDVSNEKLVLSSLLQNEAYARQVIPHLLTEYFSDPIERKVFTMIAEHFQKFNAAPNVTILKVDAQNDDMLSEDQTDLAIALIEDIRNVEPIENNDWLIETTEKFCKDKAIFNGIQKCIEIYEGQDDTLTTAAIPELLQKAIAVCFDNRVGMDFFEDADLRFEYYTRPEFKIPMHLDVLNHITNGGPPRKTMNVIVAGVNVGKSMMLCDYAAGYIKNGLNVLYVSNEMREEEIGKRIDANLLRVKTDDLASLGKERYMNRIEKLKAATQGKLVVKEYPPSVCTSLHIKSVIDDLKMKKGITVDVLIVDYILITASSRVRTGASNVNSYIYYKNVAEELRGLAVTDDLILWTAAQFNRGSMGASDGDMSDIAESKAIADVADFMVGVFRTSNSDEMGQVLGKVLKTRYGVRLSNQSTFEIGVDFDKQTLYDLDGEAPARSETPITTALTKTDTASKFASFRMN